MKYRIVQGVWFFFKDTVWIVGPLGQAIIRYTKTFLFYVQVKQLQHHLFVWILDAEEVCKKQWSL